MPSALQDAAVSAVLDRSFAAAEKDAIALDAFRSAVGPDRTIGDLTPAELADLAVDVYMPVSREVGTLLYLLARANRPALTVEFGTSYGISAIHLAAAARDNGTGRVITTELSEAKAKAAAGNLAEAGLAALVEIRIGDAFETLRELPGPVDLLLLDGWNQLYLPLLRLLEPRLSPGALVVADDITLFPDETRDYLDYVRTPGNGYTPVEIPLDDGLDLALRH
ncbi:O-methyltransferase [Frankia sp. QA3]|uniref:O-methyltransferase n=1 Tax=Frankia sp. QA3 TaxID=710111 RepID=UPI000269CD80|nr:class I SAM-dependent methyltransferase [Frankia sp. QA3]EIV96118.1 putative O-methyltransferase [Frankia sp. QA3]